MTEETPQPDTSQPRIINDGGIEFIAAPIMPEGQNPPPYAVQPIVAVQSDKGGHHWLVYQMTDGTVTAQLRLPWQLGGEFINNLAQQTQACMQRIQAEIGPQLITPGSAAFEQLAEQAKRNGHGPVMGRG